MVVCHAYLTDSNVIQIIFLARCNSMEGAETMRVTRHKTIPTFLEMRQSRPNPFAAKARKKPFLIHLGVVRH